MRILCCSINKTESKDSEFILFCKRRCKNKSFLSVEDTDGMEEEGWDGRRNLSDGDFLHESIIITSHFPPLSPLFATLLFPLLTSSSLSSSSSYFSFFISFFLRTFLNNFSRKRSEDDGKLQTLNWFISAHLCHQVSLSSGWHFTCHVSNPSSFRSYFFW